MRLPDGRREPCLLRREGDKKKKCGFSREMIDGKGEIGYNTVMIRTGE